MTDDKSNLTLLISIFTALIIFMAVALGFYYLEKRQHEAHLQEISQNIYNSISVERVYSEILLNSFHGLFNSSENVTREEFKKFYEEIKGNFPSLQAIEWIPLVSHSQRVKFEQEAKKYYPDFQFTEMNRLNELVPASKRDTYYPVYYLEPYQGNERALGYDLGSEIPRRKALEEAAKEGLITSTQKLKLVQHVEDGYGILIFNPLIIKGDLKGYLLAVYRIKNIFKSAEERFKQNRLGILVIDNKATKNRKFLYSSTKMRSHRQIGDRKHFSYPLKRSSTDWTLYTYSLVKFNLSFNSAMLLCMIAISLAIVVFYVNQLGALVKSRTKDIVREKDKAESANQAKTQFLSHISHEIRTPLTIILGNTDRLIHQSKRKTELFKMLMTIKNSGNHLVGLLDDMLNLSKIDLGEAKIKRQENSVSQLLSIVEENFADLAKDNGLELSVDAVFPLPKKILFDKKRVTQVVLNLCSNAIKFTEQGFVKVLFGYSESEEKLWVDVTDSGIGILKEQQEVIFNPFIRGKNLETGRYQGTGLGLSISKKLCKLMGGDITLSSEVGKGSTFLAAFYTPLPDIVEFYESFEEIKIPSQRRKKTGELNVRGKILLAEDSEITQEISVWMIKKMGLQCDVVSNGKDAVDYAQRHKVDLLLMDIQMPVMSGVEAVKVLRKLGYKFPVLAITANVLEEDVKSYLDSGFNDCIRKPISEEELAKKLVLYLPKINVVQKSDEFHLTEVFKLYIAGLPDQVESLQRLSSEEKWKDVERIVHTIRGTGSHFEGIEDANREAFLSILSKASIIENLIRKDKDSNKINQELTDLYKLIGKLIKKQS